MPFRLPVRVTPAFVSALSRAMAIHLPEVPSGHRSEAVARGLGYRTRASMLAEVGAGGPVTMRRLDSSAFVAHLNARGDWPCGGDAVLHAVARASVVATASEWPELRPFRIPDEPDAPASTVAGARDRLVFADAWVVPSFVQAVSFLYRRRSDHAWTAAPALAEAASFEGVDWPDGPGARPVRVFEEDLALAAASLGLPIRRSAETVSADRPGFELPVSPTDPMAVPVDADRACREIDAATTWAEVLRVAMSTGGLSGRNLADGIGTAFGMVVRWRSGRVGPGPSYVTHARLAVKALVIAGPGGQVPSGEPRRLAST